MRLTKKWVVDRLPPRPKDANKGTFGKILAIAGSENFPGAAYLSCAAAYRVGTGLVTLVTNRDTKIIISSKLPEITFLSSDGVFEKLKDYNAILVGPGLGQSKEAIDFTKKLLIQKLPKAIFDGDGLNILSKIEKWWEIGQAQMILTPHPGEMARLTGLSIKAIQANRVTTAQKFSNKWNEVIVLKGANTVIASPEGKVLISPFANPILATAGTGDILAGVIAGLVAQDLKPFDAAYVGVYIHGLAGEILREKIGNAGALASDLLPLLPQVIKKLV